MSATCRTPSFMSSMPGTSRWRLTASKSRRISGASCPRSRRERSPRRSGGLQPRQAGLDAQAAALALVDHELAAIGLDDLADDGEALSGALHAAVEAQAALSEIGELLGRHARA